MPEDIFRRELTRLNSLSDLIEIYDSVVRDSSEERLRKVDGTYLFGETSDNEKACFLSARNLFDRGLTKTVLIDNLPERNGFPGFSRWEKILSEEYGVIPKGMEINVAAGYNTLTEAESLVKYCSSENLSSFCIVAPQLHILRAFMTASSVAIRENPEINFFAFFGIEQNWEANVRHSQGTTVGKRKDLMGGEIGRIQIYTQKGDIEPAKRVLDYMAKRK